MLFFLLVNFKKSRLNLLVFLFTQTANQKLFGTEEKFPNVFFASQVVFKITPQTFLAHIALLDLSYT